MKTGKALNWDELGKIYKRETGLSPYKYEMDTIFDWAENQTDKFFVDKVKCTLHQIIEQ